VDLIFLALSIRIHISSAIKLQHGYTAGNWLYITLQLQISIFPIYLELMLKRVVAFYFGMKMNCRFQLLNNNVDIKFVSSNARSWINIVLKIHNKLKLSKPVRL
jgi:hypothetical protein